MKGTIMTNTLTTIQPTGTLTDRIVSLIIAEGVADELTRDIGTRLLDERPDMTRKNARKIARDHVADAVKDGVLNPDTQNASDRKTAAGKAAHRIGMWLTRHFDALESDDTDTDVNGNDSQDGAAEGELEIGTGDVTDHAAILAEAARNAVNHGGMNPQDALSLVAATLGL